MATRERRVDRGRRLARSDLSRLGAELRIARTSAGLSCSTVGAAVGVSGTHVARIERAVVPGISVDLLARIGSIVGLDVRVRGYPGPDALRDAAQQRLIDRLRSRLGSGLRLRTEVPLPIEGDLRSWDGWLTASHRQAGLPVEAETRLVDIQALLRRLHLKQRDGEAPVLLLIVADTNANRRAVAAARMSMHDAFPGSARIAFATLAAGQLPTTSTMLFV
jgi:transcriptional regulator with XRE-family HTH domain